MAFFLMFGSDEYLYLRYSLFLQLKYSQVSLLVSQGKTHREQSALNSHSQLLLGTISAVIYIWRVTPQPSAKRVQVSM